MQNHRDRAISLPDGAALPPPLPGTSPITGLPRSIPNGVARKRDDGAEGTAVGDRRAATSEEEKLAKMTEAVSTLLTCLGEDPNREGLVRTPYRMAKALLDCTRVRACECVWRYAHARVRGRNA
jgi:GTP cyclohydrolase I